MSATATIIEDPRSLSQNALYWAEIVTPFAEHMNGLGHIYSTQDAHEILKYKFIRRDVIDESTGEITGAHTGSTTELTKAEFSEYIERCRRWLEDVFGIEYLDEEKP